MKVFAYYDTSENAPANQDMLVTLWERGWRNRGWTPRLISERHAKRSRFFKFCEGRTRLYPFLALHASRGGLLVPMYVMNFGFLPKHSEAKIGNAVDRFPFEITRASTKSLSEWFENGQKNHNLYHTGECALFESALWTEAPLVFFPNPNKILDCGRAL